MKSTFKKKEKVFYLLNDKIYFETTLYASPFDIPISSMTFLLATTGANTTSRRRASLFIRNRRHRKAPTFRYFGSGRNICRISEPIPRLLIGCQTTLRVPEVIIPQLRPSWPADSFMFCFRELIRKQISLLLFIYLINAW